MKMIKLGPYEEDRAALASVFLLVALILVVCGAYIGHRIGGGATRDAICSAKCQPPYEQFEFAHNECNCYRLIREDK